MPYAALMVHGGAGQIEGSAVDAEGNNGERKQMVDRLAYTGKKFRASSAQLRNVEWRGIPDDTNNLVAREARAADLVIIGRKQDPRDLYYSLDPGITILRAGRPVLFVPNKTDSLEARRIVVAWKDTREARRAVRDALPFLKEAKEAMIVTVCEHGRCRGVVRVSPKKHVLRHRANRPVPLRCGLCLQRGACAQAYQCPAHASVGQRARELP
jgi:hypothetical protein